MLWKRLGRWVRFNVIFPFVSVSLSGVSDWPEKTAVMNDYCFGVSKSFVSKISVLSNMMFCWFMS